MHIGEGRFKNQSGTVNSDGLLFRGKQLVVPLTLKQEVLALVHNGSHLGMAKTKEAVRILHSDWSSSNMQKSHLYKYVCNI